MPKIIIIIIKKTNALSTRIILLLMIHQIYAHPVVIPILEYIFEPFNQLLHNYNEVKPKVYLQT